MSAEAVSERAVRLIQALNEQGCGKIVHGALQALIYATANDINAEAQREQAEIRRWERDCDL